MSHDMRILAAETIERAIAEAYPRINRHIDPGLRDALQIAHEREESPAGRQALEQILENARVAESESLPLCQDCGLAVIFAEMGEDLRVEGGLKAAIEAGVRRGYADGFLRKSVVAGIERINTGDNTPAIIHIDLVPGDGLKILLASKGGGSENMSRLRMLTPADGLAGVRQLVDETVRSAGSNPCPPIILGVGIGGNFEVCALLAKKALFRPLGSRHPEPRLAELEEELLTIANDSGVGPQGLGGRMTCLDVHVEMRPCHIASFPVAVNVECHSHRHTELEF